MTLTIILLDNTENFITYLDPDRLEVEETDEAQGLATIALTYQLEEDDETSLLFRLGNKVWVQGDPLLKDCLYVINTKVREDIDEHYVEFEAEEVLVELNYLPPTSQSYLTSTNFNLTNGNVNVDRKALTYWFGELYNIGTVQKCLSDTLGRISFTGTINLMELLRLIEEETGNQFTTQYEKDPYSNKIHRYLNFLNPSNQNKDWNFYIKYDYPIIAEDPEIDDTVGEYDDTDDETDYEEDDNTTEITLPELPAINPSKTYIKFLNTYGDQISQVLLADAGVDGDEEYLEILINYTTNAGYDLTCQVNSAKWIVEDEDYEIITGTETSIARDTSNFLPDKFILQIINPSEDILYFEHNITTVLGAVHQDILDLAYNVEELNIEIDETDTYRAVAPVLTASNTEYTNNQINTIATRWLNLSVTKGDIIPMIVEKVSYSGSTHASNVTNNYWSRCLNNQASEGYDYWHGTAYWSAPFTKRAGEMWLEDENSTDVEYTEVLCVDNNRDESYPKTLMSECSDEDVYNIYNQIALRLKEVRYKEINIETEVANLTDGLFNDYCVNDKVYVKIPDSPTLVTAKVVKTVKNAHQMSENTVELSNYSINQKYVPIETYITSKNISYTYPAKGTLTAYLKDITNDTGVANKLVTVSIYQVENNTTTYKQSANIITDTTGKISYTTGLDPGEYSAVISFGGDETHEASTITYYINVGGTLPVKQETSTSAKKTNNKTTKTNKKNKKTKTVKVKRYWTKYGLSPDKKHKYICAIGKPSASGEKDKYGYKFWKTVFYNKCPACGKASLYWGIFWAGNESANWGKFPATGRSEGGSAEGHIFCKNCDADYSVFGKSHDNYARKLKVYKKPVKSSRTEAYKLKKGKLYYDTITKTVKKQKNSTTKNYTPINQNIPKAVREQAKAVAKGKTGLAAAKLIAKWCGSHIRYQKPRYANFKKSPAQVLKTRKGNCCDQTRLMLTMMDAVGVTQKYKLTYMHVTMGPRRGHVFAKINGKYVDPCKTRNPWGNYVHGYGRIGSAPSSTYPNLPV